MPQDESANDDNGDDESRIKNIVTSVKKKWVFTNDIIAGVYLLSFIWLTAVAGQFASTISVAGYRVSVIASTDLMAVPIEWRVTTTGIAVIAAVWVFGSGAVRTASRYWGD